MTEQKVSQTMHRVNLACDGPIVRGPNKGLAATGTYAGYSRHRKIGERPCEPCRLAGSEARHPYRATYQVQPLSNVWYSIKQRCLNPNNKGYVDYGGRGVSVFPEWVGRGGYKAFAAWVNENLGPKPPNPDTWTGPKSYYSLDRIDNDGNYEPGNLRWATPNEQIANKRIPIRQSVIRELWFLVGGYPPHA